MSPKTPGPQSLTINSTYTLNSSHPIPILGYGVYQTPANITTSVTTHALLTGYRHIDSARGYRNEAPCAEAIRNSGLSREKVFFTSKIPPGKIGYEDAKREIELSLKETGLEFVDLMLLHAPFGGREEREGGWRALVEGKKAGKIKSIGISNYGVHHLDELEAYIKSSGSKDSMIDVGQWEIHPWLPRNDIVEWCRRRNIVIQAYCPVVRGKRSEEPVLKEIGEKHGKTWAQVLLRWSLQKGYVPLPKSVTPGRIEENANIYDFELDEDDMAKLHFPESYEPCAWDPTTSND